MNYQDLIGKPWAELDCRAVAVEALRRLGRQGAANALLALQGPPTDAPLRLVGKSLRDAEQVGDLIYTEPQDGQPASVAVVVVPERGRVLTSTHGGGVSLLRLGDLREPVTVWRPTA